MVPTSQDLSANALMACPMVPRAAPFKPVDLTRLHASACSPLPSRSKPPPLVSCRDPRPDLPGAARPRLRLVGFPPRPPVRHAGRHGRRRRGSHGGVTRQGCNLMSEAIISIMSMFKAMRNQPSKRLTAKIDCQGGGGVAESRKNSGSEGQPGDDLPTTRLVWFIVDSRVASSLPPQAAGAPSS